MDITTTVKKYLTERYLNLLDKDTKLKHEYKDEVFQLLQKAYAGIGGGKRWWI